MRIVCPESEELESIDKLVVIHVPISRLTLDLSLKR